MMRSLRAALLRLRSLVGRERQDRELTDEIESNIQLHVDDNIRAGMAPEEARRRALLALGGVEQAKERYRDRRGLPWLEALLQDLRFGARMLRKQKSFTAVAVATLAIGFGPPIAIFTLANWIVLRPVSGVRDTGSVSYYLSGRPSPRGVGTTVFFLSYLNVRDVVARLRTLDVAAFQGATNLAVGTANRPARFVNGQYVSGTYFDVLGVAVQAGRPLGPADDDPANPALAAVISDELWATLFDRQPSAIGQTIVVNGRHVTVVGVAAAAFKGVRRFDMDALWLPGVSEPMIRQVPGRRADDRAVGGYHQFIGRLVRGATWQQADAELASMIPWLVEQFPRENARLTATGFHNQGLIDAYGRERLVPIVAIMFGASALVLLIASSNVASLLLMRGVLRQDEVAVRAALGAGRGRIFRQHVTEATVLWLVGAAGGAIFVWAVLKTGVTAALSVLRIPDVAIPLDAQALAFGGLLALVVGLLFSLVPAWAATKVRNAIAPVVTGSTVTMRRVRLAPVLTAAQLSASLALIVGALMLGATVRHLLTLDLGFQFEHVTTFSVRPPVGASPQAAYFHVNEFKSRLAARPDVVSVAVAPGAPFAGAGNSFSRIRPEGAQEFVDISTQHLVSPDYFSTLRIPLQRGRGFSPQELGVPGRAHAGVVLVSETLARQLFGTVDVLGRRVEMPVYQRTAEQFSIIGVVKDVRYVALDQPAPAMVYRPDGVTWVSNGATLIVRTREPMLPVEEVERIATALGSPVPPDIRPLGDAVSRARGEWDVLAGLMAVLAAIASVVAAVGVYGVVAFAAAARRPEFGIRLALGASLSDIRRQVFRHATVLTIGGLVAGTAAAFALVRVLRARLVGVSEFDPLLWGSAAIVLVALVFVAAALPARKASRINLVETLKVT